MNGLESSFSSNEGDRTPEPACAWFSFFLLMYRSLRSRSGSNQSGAIVALQPLLMHRLVHFAKPPLLAAPCLFAPAGWTILRSSALFIVADELDHPFGGLHAVLVPLDRLDRRRRLPTRFLPGP
jgi:hypothetical protein